MTFLRIAAVVWVALAAVVAVPANANADGIKVELNKLVPQKDACRVYMVFANGSNDALESFKPDIVFFDAKGVIRHRLVVEGGPLPVGKTKVKLFDASGMPCPDIGRMLLNDIASCSGGSWTESACLSATQTRSLTEIPFIK